MSLACSLPQRSSVRCYHPVVRSPTSVGLLSAGVLLVTAACSSEVSGTASAPPTTITTTTTATATATVTVTAAGGQDSDAGATTTSGVTQSADTAAPATTAGSTPSSTTAAPTAPVAVTGTSTATVDADGIITVAVGSPEHVIDVYEDSLCPVCGRFEARFGGDVAQAVNAGTLAVRYRLMNFLNPYSASGDYSTRAFGAMLVLARESGDVPGLFEAYHATLFDGTIQPEEKAATDLSDADLADLARQLGAPDSTVAQIAAGAGSTDASAAAALNLTALQQVSERPGTPTVVQDGAVVPLQDDWLGAVLAG